MTYTEAYKNLPCATKMIIGDYAIGFDFGDDCMESIKKLAGDKEASISALAERYGEWEHQKQKALEKLADLGIDEHMAYGLYIGYCEYHNK